MHDEPQSARNVLADGGRNGVVSYNIGQCATNHRAVSGQRLNGHTAHAHIAQAPHNAVHITAVP